MDQFLVVHVTEFQNNEERMVESQVKDVTTYEDGKAEFGVQITGKEHYVFVRFNLAELLRIALTSESKEEAV